jgi:hypothetical protein
VPADSLPGFLSSVTPRLPVDHPQGTGPKANLRPQCSGTTGPSKAGLPRRCGVRYTSRSGEVSTRQVDAVGIGMLGQLEQTSLRLDAADPTVVGNAVSTRSDRENDLEGRQTPAPAFRRASQPPGDDANRDGGVAGRSRPTAKSCAVASAASRTEGRNPPREDPVQMSVRSLPGEMRGAVTRNPGGEQAQGSIGRCVSGNAGTQQRTRLWSKALWSAAKPRRLDCVATRSRETRALP